MKFNTLRNEFLMATINNKNKIDIKYKLSLDFS